MRFDLRFLSFYLLILISAGHYASADVLKPDDSILSNSGVELDENLDEWPDGWPEAKGLSWEFEEGNRFLRLESTEPDSMVMAYREIAVPEGVHALKFSWKQRITNLERGSKAWFNARILLEFMDADRKKLTPSPKPFAYGQNHPDWEVKEFSFLVPAGAQTVKFMPCLFHVKVGSYDLDDITLVPTDTAALEAAARKREEEARMRYVAPEEPNKANWPSELHVEGNRLINAEGEEVWLQGLNAGNLETLPHDKQVIKSAVVGIEEWNANVVRLPMKEEFWYGESVYQKDGGQAYRDTIDQIVTLVANRGAYLVLDLHRYRAPKQKHADFWVDAANHFKNHPAVLFDLMNEPHSISWEVWRNGGWVGEKKGTDESAFLTEAEKKANQGYESVGMQGLLDAVRSTGARNIVVVGGIGWAGDLSGVVNGYALDEHEGGNGIMYSWHQYNWHTGWAKTVLPVAEKYPILVGEVGADTNKMDFIPHDIQESPYTWVPDMLGFIQKYKLNWTAWCFHPRATPVLIKDWTYEPTEFWGVFAKEALHGKQFEMKRMR